MKYGPIATLFLLIALSLGAQKPVSLIDTEFRIRNQSSDFHYFHLAKGDSIVFDLKMADTLTLRSFSFEEYSGGILYREIHPSEINSKSVRIQHDGIYYFELHQQGFLAGKRFGHFKAVRYPESEKTKDLNTTVYWRTVTDTVWYSELENRLVRSDTISDMIVMQHIDLGKKKSDNRAAIHFTIPDSTWCWAWCVSTGADGDMTFNGISEEMLEKNAVVRNHGLMTYLALGGSVSFVQKPGMPNVLVDFTPSVNAATFFLSDEDISSESFSNRVTFGYKQHCNDSVSQLSMLIYNDSRKKTTAFVYITAVRIANVYEMVPVRKFRIEEIQQPFVK